MTRFMEADASVFPSLTYRLTRAPLARRLNIDMQCRSVEPMRIGIVVTGIGVLPGYETCHSGHAQVALHTASLLAKSGHHVELFVTRQHDGLVWPKCLPKNVPLHELTDARWRGRTKVQFHRRGGYRPLAIGRQMRELHRHVRRLRLDVLHLFGFERIAALAGLLTLTKLPCPTVATVYGPPTKRTWSWLARHAKTVITATRHVQRAWQAAGIRAVQVHHGTVRHLAEELPGKALDPHLRSRVLFWRALNPETGGDLCLEAFGQLALEFPDISFDFALRTNPEEIQGAHQLAEQHKNVHVYRHPYPPGITIAQLVSDSLCCVFPYRRLTIHPQLSIAETLAAGTACIGSNRSSIPELISTGRTGELIDVDDSTHLARTLRRLLKDRRQLWAMCQLASSELNRAWNWDRYVDHLEESYQQAASTARTFSRAS